MFVAYTRLFMGLNKPPGCGTIASVSIFFLLALSTLVQTRPYLFLHNIWLLSMYVDDILITGSSCQSISHLITALCREFAVKDLGGLNYFLGHAAHPVKDGLFLSQSQYIYNLIRRTNMLEAKPRSSPMASSQSLSLFSGAPLPDPFHYRSVVGALQYLTLTRPDISFMVNKVCQFMHKPTEVHWSAVKRILRYLKFTISFGFLIHPSQSTQLSIFSDADWAGCPDDRKSTSSYCIYFGDNLISWSYKNNRS